MLQNVGGLDRILRLLAGLALLAFAMRIGFHETGYNWIGWLGVVPLATALVGNCPLYSIFGFSTCPIDRN